MSRRRNALTRPELCRLLIDLHNKSFLLFLQNAFQAEQNAFEDKDQEKTEVKANDQQQANQEVREKKAL